MQSIAVEVAGAAGVLPVPAPTLVLRAAEPKRVTFHVRIWLRPGTRAQVTSAVVRDIAAALDRLGIEATVESPPPPMPAPPPAVL
jgi:small-conductance mechanosensitive channel